MAKKKAATKRRGAKRRKAKRKAPAKKKAPKGAKLDLAKLRPEQFKAKAKPEIVKLSPAQYIVLEGRGAPEGEGFGDAVGALYGVAYTLKFAMKPEGRDFRVSALEGLWWAGRSGVDFTSTARDKWRWKLLIMLPDFVRKADLGRAKKELVRKKGRGLFERVEIEKLREGRCVQMLHVGPYSDEPASIRAMRDLMAEEGLAPRGRHHEIYMSDPRRTAPAKLRTILRQPVG
ncbi:MAG: GyrI-like domain-containing protein [Planctomycetota bacterium]|jgi:hypothetical protein